MKRRFPSLAILTALFALSATAAWAGDKVQVCHIPPGNPSNFHTITVSQNAVQAHLGHGDLVGACSSNCESLCSADHPCTTGECSCRCVTEIPDFLNALNGQFGLTDCKAAVNPPLQDYAFLVTGDGTLVGAQISSGTLICGFLPGTYISISPEETAACLALVRQKAAAASLTCTPF